MPLVAASEFLPCALHQVSLGVVKVTAASANGEPGARGILQWNTAGLRRFTCYRALQAGSDRRRPGLRSASSSSWCQPFWCQ
jgi:hypothetical protein